MTIVLDINTRFSDIGLAGEASPSIIPSFIGYPVSPVGLDVKELGFVPLESERKLDHVDALPVLNLAEVEPCKLLFNKDPLAVLCRSIAEQYTGERELLLSCPSLCGADFRSAVAEVLFESHHFDRILPQRSSVLSAFGNGRVSAVALDVSCQYIQLSTIQDGNVLNEAQEATRDSYVSIEQVPLQFPYDPTSNPFVSKSFVEFAKYNQVYQSALHPPAATVDAAAADDSMAVEGNVAPDGTRLTTGLIAAVNRLSSEATRRVTNLDVLSAVVIGGEVPYMLQYGEEFANQLHVGGIPYMQKSADGAVGKGWRFLGHDRSTWFGGSILGSLSVYAKTAIDRAQWNEHGPSIWEKSGLC